MSDIKSKGIKETISTILAKICYPVADELGEEFAVRVGNWRKRNSLKILERADQKYNELGLNSRYVVHPRLAHKIMEDGSWSEDDDLLMMWSGLLISSCSDKKLDDSNLLFINILSQLTSVQVRILNYVCENTDPKLSSAGWVHGSSITIKTEDLKKISEENDVHRLDREMDSLRSMELIQGGFPVEGKDAVIEPTGICLQLFVRSKGYIGSPVDYFGLASNE